MQASDNEWFRGCQELVLRRLPGPNGVSLRVRAPLILESC